MGSSGSPAALSAASSDAMSPSWEMPVTTRPTRYPFGGGECSGPIFSTYRRSCRIGCANSRLLETANHRRASDRHALHGAVELRRPDEGQDRAAQTDQPDQR